MPAHPMTGGKETPDKPDRPVGNPLSRFGNKPKPEKPTGNPLGRYGDKPSTPTAPAAQPAASGGSKTRWQDSTTAQRQRGRVGHLRTAIQSSKNELAQQRRRAATGSPDQRRAARLAQGPIVDRIKAQAAQRDREYNKALKMGWSEDDLKPRSGNGRTPQAPRVAGGSGSGSGNPSPGGGSGSGSGGSGSKSPRSVTPRKRDLTVDQKNAKSNTVLGKALKMYGDPRMGPDKTGEMLQDGAKSPHHVKLTGKEFQSFKKKYLATHDDKNLSDWSLRAMAKMLKYKNKASAKKYGLSEYKPPEG